MLKFLDEHFEEVFIVFLMAAMSVLIGAQIFMRYVMQSSLSWSEELARYFFIWMTYLGIAYAVRKDAHIRVTMGVEFLPQRWQVVLRIVTHVIFAAFAFFVMYQGWFLVEKTLRFGQKSASLGIPMGIIYMAPLTGFALTGLRLAQAIVLDARLLGRGEAA